MPNILVLIMRTYINVPYALVLEERDITDIRTNDFEVIQRTYKLSFAQEVHDDDSSVPIFHKTPS